MLLLALYGTHTLPKAMQYIRPLRPTDGSELLDSPTSLIQAGLCGDLEAIGNLIHAGGMVNEADEGEHTLLHLVACGRCDPHGYQVALELVRHGGYGVHWEAITAEGKTALTLAEERLANESLEKESREEVENIIRLLTARRLPPGDAYVFPCMDPDYCPYCSSAPCICGKQDLPDMPGVYVP